MVLRGTRATLIFARSRKRFLHIHIYVYYIRIRADNDTHVLRAASSSSSSGLGLESWIKRRLRETPRDLREFAVFQEAAARIIRCLVIRAKLNAALSIYVYVSLIPLQALLLLSDTFSLCTV